MFDVIICGAGPVGLFLACELALHKCSVLILEKSETPRSPLKKIPFGIRGLSAPSIEALYRRDLLKELKLHTRMKNPHAIHGAGPRQVGHFAGIPFFENKIDASQWKYRLPSSTDTSLISEIEELETIFTARAEALGVVIKRGIAASDIQQDENSVTVNSFKAKWLVGCDGGRSTVRKAGGFEFAGTEPEFTGYTTLVDIADPEKLKPGRNITPSGMYMQSQPGYIMIQDFDKGAFHHPDNIITRDHVQEVLRRISGTDVTITALHTATTWTDRARQATSYRNGRIFLAGDAAHIHSPLGGQGLNLGLGDAMNLGWKLAATIHHQASESLLDTYQTERHPIGEKVLDWSRAQVAVMRSTALNAIMRDLINTPDGATYIAGRVWGISQHLVGGSVPNFELKDGRKIGEFMHEGKWMLLDFEMNHSLHKLVSEYGDQIKYVSGEAQEQFGLKALLIRPDGMIAWATENKVIPDLKLVLGVLCPEISYAT